MLKGPNGIKYEDVRTGRGELVRPRDLVHIRLSIFLHRGDLAKGPIECDIDLARRRSIAGLRSGLLGMRTGGLRRIQCPPHLAYGEAGLPPTIPPNALLFLEVEILQHRGPSSLTKKLPPPPPTNNPATP